MGGRLNFKTSMGKYADQRYTLKDKDTVEIQYIYLDISSRPKPGLDKGVVRKDLER